MEYTTITKEQLKNILTGLNPSYLDHTGGIHVKGIIVEFAVFFSEIPRTTEFKFERRIIFEKCEFKDLFELDGGTFMEAVEITNCHFEKDLNLSNATFHKPLSINGVDAEYMTVNGGIYKEIHLLYDIPRKIHINAGEFDVLGIDYLPTGHGNLLEELHIHSDGKLSGNIKIKNRAIEEIIVSGPNGGKEYEFEGISCGQMKIYGFSNTGTFKIYGLRPLEGRPTAFKMLQSNLSKAQLHRISFDKFSRITFRDSNISESNIINCSWGNDNFNQHLIEFDGKLHLKEIFRQLKFIYEKQGDRINEAYFYRMEMNCYYTLLKWTHPLREVFWEKLILLLSETFTNYGSSFKRPLLMILFLNWVFILFGIEFFELKELKLSFSDATYDAFYLAVGEYCKLLNPLHQINPKLEGFGITWDLISRIVNSYLIYGLIRASRKFLR